MESQIYADPHVTNLDGVKFDIMKADTHRLVQIPRYAAHADTMLQVDAVIEDLVPHWCEGLFIRKLTLMGKWVEEFGSLEFSTGTNEFNTSRTLRVRARGNETDFTTEELFRYTSPNVVQVTYPQARLGKAEKKLHTKHVTLHLGGAVLEVTQQHERIQKKGVNYLNFGVSRLSRVGIADVGGLLGSDDHHQVSQIPAECFNKEQKKHSLREDRGQRTWADADADDEADIDAKGSEMRASWDEANMFKEAE